MADNRQIAQDVVEAVGGKGNITFATHCMTRLRLNLRDQSKVDDERVKAVKGVLGVKRVGDQYQVIIGQNVAKVYPEVLAVTGLEEQAAVDENLDADAPKGRLTPKKVGANVLDYISGSMVPAIPAIMISGLFKTIQVILGPTVLGLITETSSFYAFLNIVYNAGMYFLPFFLAYTASKKLGTSSILAGFLAALLLEPNFVALASEAGASLDFLGLPIRLVSYGQSVVPILLAVWVMSYVERFFRKVIPDLLSTVFVPFLTIVVMAPLTYVILAPIGANLGELIANSLVALANVGGVISVLATTILMAVQPFLVMTGMHMALVTFGLNSVAESGVDPFILVCNVLSNFAIWGAVLAAAVRFKDADDKANAIGGFVSGILGGVNEPSLFGVCLEHRRLFKTLTIANVVVGILAGILHVYFYNLGTSSIMCLFCFITDVNPMNVVNAIICGGVGFGLSFVLSLVFGLSKEEIKGRQA